VLDGIIDLEVPRTNWPTISFIDEAGKEALAIQIDPSSSCLSIKNIFDVSFHHCLYEI
jgi:hypothetical protein